VVGDEAKSVLGWWVMDETEAMIRRILRGEEEGFIGRVTSRIKEFAEGCLEEIKRFKPC